MKGQGRRQLGRQRQQIEKSQQHRCTLVLEVNPCGLIDFLFTDLNTIWGSARLGFGVQINCFHRFCPSCSVLISYTRELLLFLYRSKLAASHKAQQDTAHFCDACPQGHWGVGSGLGLLNSLGITQELSSLTSLSKQGKIRVWSGCSGALSSQILKIKKCGDCSVPLGLAAGLSNLVIISFAVAFLLSFQWAPLRRGWLLSLHNVLLDTEGSSWIPPYYSSG